MKISEMMVGHNITAEVVLAGASIRQTKGNPPRDYLNVDLTDGTDTLEGKLWNYDNSLGTPAANKVYEIVGTIGEYQGKKQITLSRIRLSDCQDLMPFSCTYNGDLDMLAAMLRTRIDRIMDYKLRDITKYIYKKYWDEILRASSAKGIHHVGIGGNASHAIEVYDIAVGIAELYPSEVNIDLVRAGALLHDIGKVFTYRVNGAVVEYTLNGILYEHIANGILVLNEAAQNLPAEYNETFALLTHIISSHHGQLEYGSPVTPKFAEAYIVSFADGASASLDTLFAANVKAEKDGKSMTDKIWTHNNAEHLLQKTVAEMLRDH